MKNKLTISLISLVFILTAVSCEMDRYPFDRIEQSQAFKTVDDAKALRNGIYASMRGRLHGVNMYTPDIQADIFNATLDYGNRNGSPHDWVNFLADDYSILSIWSAYYLVLADVNNFLEEIDDIIAENDKEKASIKKFKGEVYFTRAFYYHNLVKRFAKDYEPSTANTDLGVPLVLSFDISLKPKRASVAEVYQQITDDLNKAKTLLASTAGSQSAKRITIDAATALEARVKMDMHDWSGAIAAASSLISSGKYPLISDFTEYKKMWLNDVSTEVIFQYPLKAPKELGNSMGLYLGFRPDDKKYSPDWVPQQWVVDMYEDTDIRKKVYLQQKLVHIQGTDYKDIWCVNKFPGNPALKTGASTNYRNMPKVFRVAEMYLIVAEAGAQSEAESQALNALNELRTKRGIAALTGLTGAALMDAVKAERTRELLCEGNRLDDLKRWKMGFTRTAPQNVNLIVPGDNFSAKRVAAGADKFVWGIPTNDITTNPNIQQNPGW